MTVFPIVLAALLLSLGRTPASADDGASRPAPREPGIYVLNVMDGAVTRLGGPGSVAVLSPDGSMAAVATREGAEAGVRIIELVSGRVSVSLASEAGQADTPVWSPDGRLLAFRFDRFGRPDPDAVPPTGLYVVDPRTRETVQVFRDPPVLWTWAPDGRSITALAFEFGDGLARYSIVALDIATGAVGGTLLEPSASICPTALAWSTDGQRLAFQGGIFRQGCGEAEALGLWLWEAGGGAPRQLTRGALYVGPSWTADGRILVRRIGGFEADDPRAGPRPDAVVLVDTDGDETTLAVVPATPFPFVPFQQTAGRTVIYEQRTCDAGSVFAVEVTGGDPRRLSDAAVVAVSPRLARDGLRVAWEAAGPGASDLQLAMTDRTEVRTLLAGAPGLNLGGWSGDGRFLSFSIDPTGASSCPEG